MGNWLTTHYPHPIVNDHPWHIYLQREHKDAADEIAIGDRVFFYEYKYQKPLRDGTEYPIGRQGIVRVARVSKPMYRRDTVIEYADGTTGYWSWGIPTEDPDTNGFVRRQDLLPVIHYKRGSVLRGFNNGTGLMALDDAQAAELLTLFKAGRPLRDS